MNWITVKKFSELSGYTAKAIYNKVERGTWKNNIHWRKAPDGRLFICVESIEEWVMGVSA